MFEEFFIWDFFILGKKFIDKISFPYFLWQKHLI